MGVASRILFAIGYTLLYAFMALIAGGSGHGTILFLFPLLTWVFYLAAIIILRRFGDFTFFFLMALHYFFLLFLFWTLAIRGLDPNDKKYWANESGVVVVTTLLYVIGQLVTWGIFIIRKRKDSA